MKTKNTAAHDISKLTFDESQEKLKKVQQYLRRTRPLVEIRNDFDWKIRHATVGESGIPYSIRPTFPTPASPVSVQMEFPTEDRSTYYGSIVILRDSKGRYFLAKGDRVERELSVGDAVSLATRWLDIEGYSECAGSPEPELKADIDRVIAAGIRAIGQDVPALAHLERLIG